MIKIIVFHVLHLMGVEIVNRLTNVRSALSRFNWIQKLEVANVRFILFCNRKILTRNCIFLIGQCVSCTGNTESNCFKNPDNETHIPCPQDHTCWTNLTSINNKVTVRRSCMKRLCPNEENQEMCFGNNHNDSSTVGRCCDRHICNNDRIKKDGKCCGHAIFPNVLLYSCILICIFMIE